MARILLIDDDDDMRTMLGLTLTHFGHTVIEAQNGKQGLAIFAQANADLVMTDMVMPEKEGIEVVIELRKNNPDLKIIAMSGGGRGSGTGYLLAAKGLGANKVLAKPFSNEELNAAIGELLPDTASR
jgi:CheY-like chemotaxis protein